MRIEEQLKWIENDCNEWNTRITSVAEDCIHYRKNRLLEQAEMVSALGIPIKRRPDSAVTNTAVPVVRKRRPVELPPAPKETFRPEPELPDTEYDYILEVIDNVCRKVSNAAQVPSFTYEGRTNPRPNLGQLERTL